MKKGITKVVLIFFVLGMLTMFVLDMIFHFNDSIEKKIDREMNKTKKKIENIIK